MLNIDVSTDEKKRETVELFKTFRSKRDIFRYYDVCPNTANNKILSEVAKEIGFDFTYYKRRRESYCIQCGKMLTKYQEKFCSSSCSAKYNNKGRNMSEETKEKIRNKAINSYKERIYLTDENIAEIIDYVRENDINKISYADLSRKYKIGVRTLKRILSEQGIPLRECKNIRTRRSESSKYCLHCGKPTKKLNMYCSKECMYEDKRDRKIELWKIEPDRYSKEDIPPFIREYVYKKYEYTCSSCGNNDVNPYTGKSIMQIHHIDGNCKNNSESNLTLLCPNCHSKTDTFGSLNVGNGTRSYFREYHRCKCGIDSSTNIDINCE